MSPERRWTTPMSGVVGVRLGRRRLPGVRSSQPDRLRRGRSARPAAHLRRARKTAPGRPGDRQASPEKPARAFREAADGYRHAARSARRRPAASSTPARSVRRQGSTTMRCRTSPRREVLHARAAPAFVSDIGSTKSKFSPAPRMRGWNVGTDLPVQLVDQLHSPGSKRAHASSTGSSTATSFTGSPCRSRKLCALQCAARRRASRSTTGSHR